MSEILVEVSGEERRARVALSRLAEPRDAAVSRLVATVGPVEALAQIVGGVGSLKRFAPRLATLDVDRDLAIGRRLGARVVVPGDSEWPERLHDLEVPPWCLWVRGPARLDEVLPRSVSIVGSRMATAYGESIAADLAAALASRGWAVVSGAAFGIDGAAHRGALSSEGVTVAVLAGGIDRPYPAAHAALITRIAETGAVVSEVAPGSAPMRARFLSRNRLIAAMARGVVVVEADLRSGSLNTSGQALELGRMVGAVPGPVTSMTSAGCHDLIRNKGATLVTDVAEVLDLVGAMGEDAMEPRRGPELPTDGLPPDQAAVHEALPVRGWMDLDRICVLTTLAPLAVRTGLFHLEDFGLAVGDGAGRWRKAPAPRPA